MIDNDAIIAQVLQFEGRFVNNPADRGGSTNFGITAAEFGRVRGFGGPASVAQMQAMRREDAISIYRSDYLDAPHFNEITDGNLRMVVVDCGVIHGVGRAVRWLQQAALVTQDGVLGQATLQAVNDASASLLARTIIGYRIAYLGALISKDHSQAVFAGGWFARVATLMQYA